MSSSGLNSWRVGNVQAAARPGPALDWALGDGAGEDVMLQTHPESADNGKEDARPHTLGQILYSFEHMGNKHYALDLESRA